MANVLNQDGLTLETRNKIIETMKGEWQAIYGEDVNFSSNTSDGQLLEIFAQYCIDNNELCNEVYNSFSPNKIGGTVQDERYAINGIFRKAGDYTIQPIKITVNKTVNLNGIDSGNPFTVQSDDGTQWLLIDDTTITLSQSPLTLSFRAVEKGNILPTVGTITTQVTVVQGVTSVINEVAPTTYGSDEETDYEFSIRREQSVANASENNTTTIQGTILSLEGVSQCRVFQYIETRDENDKLIPDANGVPPYTIWVIVEGGSPTEIINAIYNNASNTMLKGSVSGTIQTSAGQSVTIHYDRPNAVALYIKFKVKRMSGTAEFDYDSIKEYIVENLLFTMGQYADTSYVTDIAREAVSINAQGGVAIDVQISTNGTTWVDYIASSSPQNQFVTDTTKITITEEN